MEGTVNAFLELSREAQKFVALNAEHLVEAHLTEEFSGDLDLAFRQLMEMNKFASNALRAHQEKLNSIRSMMAMDKAIDNLDPTLEQLQEAHARAERMSTTIEADAGRYEQEVKGSYDVLKTRLHNERLNKGKSQYHDLRRRLWEMEHSDDEGLPPMSEGSEDDTIASEVVLSRSRPNLRCPLTQSRFVEPVKNIACGHVFSKQAIVSLLSNHPIRCPISGCEKSITIHTLTPDSETYARLNRRSNSIFPQ